MQSNVVKDSGGTAVAASTVDAQVSSLFHPSDPFNIDLTIELSSAVLTNTIAFTLKDSAQNPYGSTPTDFYPVGSESSVSVVRKTFLGGTAEVTDITLPATAGATQADYLSVTAVDGTTYAIWLDIDAAGTAPSGVLYVAATQKIMVSIVTGGTAAENAALFRAALLANTAWVADFTTSAITTATMTLTQILTGASTDPAPKNANDGGAGSITLTVTTQGSDGNVVVSTSRVTSTSHGYSTGDRIIVSGAGLPGGLTTGTTMYAIVIDANVLKFATTQALARAGTAVTLTSFGVGTGAIYKGSYNIRMTSLDATDLAQLPLQATVQVVANTGVSDTVTVSSIWASHKAN